MLRFIMGQNIDIRRAILEACDDLLSDSSEPVDDSIIATLTGINPKELRQHLRELDEDRYISLIALEDRFKVSFEPAGRLYLYQRITRAVRRKVLDTCVDLSADAGHYFEDLDVASQARIRLIDVRVCLSCMFHDGYIDRVADHKDGKARNQYTVTPLGRLKNRIYQPFPDEVEDDQSPTASLRFQPHQPITQKKKSLASSSSIAASSTDRNSRTILFLGANPLDTVWLQLGREVRQIERGLERAKRERFHFIQKWAVTDDDLRRALLDNEPEIVHFCGHGSGEDGLKFEDESGQTHLIFGDALARLFELCADHVRCVVLNACYSEVQAVAISKHIEYVVGMSKTIGDEAAVKFAVGFYDALGAGRKYDKAFKFGRNAIDLSGIPEHQTPVLKKRQQRNRTEGPI